MNACDNETLSKLNNFLLTNKLTVMSSPGCGPCEMTKKLLDENNHKYSVKDLSEESEQMISCIFEKTKSQYVPQVFINNKFIGGYRELKFLNDTKLLDDLV